MSAVNAETRMGFKIIRRVGTGSKLCLKSYCKHSDWEVPYRPGVPTIRHPSCGPLALFDTLEHAIQFGWEDRWREPLFVFQVSCEIWECEYTPSQETILYRPFIYTNSRNTFFKPDFPGTRFAESITLRRKVEITQKIWDSAIQEITRKE